MITSLFFGCGNWARKGRNSKERPWRQARIIHVTEDLLPVAEEDLIALRDDLRDRHSIHGPQTSTTRSTSASVGSQSASAAYRGRFLIDEYLDACEIEVLGHKNSDGITRRYVQCLHDSDHTGTDAYVYVNDATGIPGYYCSHDSCQSKLGWKQGNVDKSRWYFITHDEIAKLLETAPNQDWRTITALCRLGGLRCPSEVLSLRWEDVLWAQSRIVITSPKTEHHAGKESRVMPLFPLLRPHLEQAFEAATDGAEYVIAHETYRKATQGPSGWKNCNLRTQMEKIIRRVGLVQWPRLFHNLRATRETELAEEFPIHVVAAWMENTPRVALKHYLQVTDADFEKAIQAPAEREGSLALHNPVQQVAANGRMGSQANSWEAKKIPVSQHSAASCDSVQSGVADGEGFEPPVRSPVQQFSRLPP